MTPRFIASLNTGKTRLTVNSLRGDAVLVLEDEFGQKVSLDVDLSIWVQFCRDSLARCREQGTDVPNAA